MKEYKEKLHGALAEIEKCPVTMRSVEQATAVAELLCWLDKLGSHAESDESFDREAAERWARHMENADGTTGAHWTMEQTTALADGMGIPREIPRWAWGVAMNMMYSDYFDVAMKYGQNRPEFYADLARAFLLDKDAPSPTEKLMAYYEHIASAKTRD